MSRFIETPETPHPSIFSSLFTHSPMEAFPPALQKDKRIRPEKPLPSLPQSSRRMRPRKLRKIRSKQGAHPVIARTASLDIASLSSGSHRGLLSSSTAPAFDHRRRYPRTSQPSVLRKRRDERLRHSYHPFPSVPPRQRKQTRFADPPEAPQQPPSRVQDPPTSALHLIPRSEARPFGRFDCSLSNAPTSSANAFGEGYDDLAQPRHDISDASFPQNNPTFVVGSSGGAPPHQHPHRSIPARETVTALRRHSSPISPPRQLTAADAAPAPERCTLSSHPYGALPAKTPALQPRPSLDRPLPALPIAEPPPSYKSYPICREFIQSQHSYLESLRACVRNDAVFTPPVNLLLSLLSIIQIGQDFLTQMEALPTMHGIATSFLSTCDKLEAALLRWSLEVNEFFESQDMGLNPPELESKIRPQSVMKRLTFWNRKSRSTSGKSKLDPVSVSPDRVWRKSTDPGLWEMSILPTQRIMRYEVLFKEMLSMIDRTDESYDDVERAYHASTFIVTKLECTQHKPRSH